MPHSTNLIILGALCATGIAAGITLGHATVGDINPANLKNEDAPFYSDLVPGGGSRDDGQRGDVQRGDWQQVQAQEYQAVQGPPPPPACLDCTWPVDPAPRHDPAVDRALEAWTPPSEPLRAAVAEAPVDPDVARVVRYASPTPKSDEAALEQGQGRKQDPDGL
jgi:hypothetical protein